MKKMDDLYVGQKSRPETCPVCMRKKEDAIAEQLRAGSPCEHEQCVFRTEMEMVAAILKAPNVEQLKSVTSESIETNKKTLDLLVTLRESVREMKKSFKEGLDSDVTSANGTNTARYESDHANEHNCEQLQSIMDRIDLSTKTMSLLIERMNSGEVAVSAAGTENSVEKQEGSGVYSDSYEKTKREWEAYLHEREDYNRRLDEAFAAMHQALAGMREAVDELKKESQSNNDQSFETNSKLT